MSVAEQIQDLMNKIPGYRGYAERESRREADKKLREATAAAFESQINRITRVQEQLINAGDFESVEMLDQIISRLQHLVERLRTASYGYSGLFDKERVDETFLDRLYVYDLEIANGIEKVGDQIARLSSTQNSEEAVQRLQQQLDALHETFSQRNHLINTFPQQDGEEETE